jgi:hypothetical protein
MLASIKPATPKCCLYFPDRGLQPSDEAQQPIEDGERMWEAAGNKKIYRQLAGAVARDDILKLGIAQGESQLGEKVQVGAKSRADEGINRNYAAVLATALEK